MHLKFEYLIRIKNFNWLGTQVDQQHITTWDNKQRKRQSTKYTEVNEGMGNRREKQLELIRLTSQGT